ncbi:hypothetical protein BGZ88_005228, partial [Linnemannia elongata]
MLICRQVVVHNPEESQSVLEILNDVLILERFLRMDTDQSSLSLLLNRDPIEFSDSAPDKEEGDAQEKGLEVVDESQVS